MRAMTESAAMTSQYQTQTVSAKVAPHFRMGRRIALLVLLVASCLVTPSVFGQTGALAPNPKFVGLDNNGNPCSGCKLYTFTTGTTTPQATYTDSGLSVPNANPIIMDSAGRATIYLSISVSYKFVFKTAADVTLWTVDPVTPTNTSAVSLGEYWIFGGISVSPVTTTTYPSGATFDKLHVGTSVLVVDSATIPTGVYKLEANGVVTAGTLTVALVNLTDGSPDTAIVTCAFTSTTGERVQSSAITFATAGTSKTYAIKTKQSSGSGYAWGVKIIRIS